jgi:hypothetical protein
MVVTVITGILFYEQRNYVTLSLYYHLAVCPVIKLCFKYSCIILTVSQNV